MNDKTWWYACAICVDPAHGNFALATSTTVQEHPIRHERGEWRRFEMKSDAEAYAEKANEAGEFYV